MGKNPYPSAGIIDSQSTKTVLKGDYMGFDGNKIIKGVKRNILVDTNGLVISNYVTPANMSDKEGAKRVIGGIQFRTPRLTKIWADCGYGGSDLKREFLNNSYDLEVVKRPGKEFKIVGWRWIVERTFAWLDQNRRMSKDYERYPQSSETMIEICMIRLMLKRLRKYQDF